MATQNTYSTDGSQKRVISHPYDARIPFERGSAFYIGKYNQNDLTRDTPIEWIVIDSQYDKLLLVSKYALDYKPYNVDRQHVTWDNCSLRKWLNGSFYSFAFSPEEKELVCPRKNVTTPKKSLYYYDYGKSKNVLQPVETIDNVFILDEKEFKALKADESVLTETKYCITQRQYTYSSADKCWIREFDHSSSDAYTMGRYSSSGSSTAVDSKSVVVRPAIMISLLK